MQFSAEKPVEVYKNYDDAESTPCRICYNLSPITPIYPFEHEGIQLLKYCLLYELINEKNSVFVCEDCLEALNRCAKNITYMRRRHQLLPILYPHYFCWTCKTSGRTKLKKFPENSTKQIVFCRLMGVLVLESSIWICNTCEDVVNDLNEIIQSVHNTEMAMMEESPQFLDIPKLTSGFAFMNTRMQAVLNLETLETACIPPYTALFDDSIYVLLTPSDIQRITEFGDPKHVLNENGNEPLNTKTQIKSITYNPVPNLNNALNIRDFCDSTEIELFKQYYQNADSKTLNEINIISCESGNLADSRKEALAESKHSPELLFPIPSEECTFSFLDMDDLEDELAETFIGEDLELTNTDPFSVLIKQLEHMEKTQKEDRQEENESVEEEYVYEEEMSREDWGIKLNENYWTPTFVCAYDPKTTYAEDSDSPKSRLQDSVSPNVGQINSDNEPPCAFYATSPSSDPYMEDYWTFREFCNINVSDSSSEKM